MNPELARFLLSEVLKPFPESSLWEDYVAAYADEKAGPGEDPENEIYRQKAAEFVQLYDRAVAELEVEAASGQPGQKP